MDTPKQAAMARDAKVARERATTALLAVYRLESGLRQFQLAVDGAVYGVARHKIDEPAAANEYVSPIWTALAELQGDAEEAMNALLDMGRLLGWNEAPAPEPKPKPTLGPVLNALVKATPAPLVAADDSLQRGKAASRHINRYLEDPKMAKRKKAKPAKKSKSRKVSKRSASVKPPKAVRIQLAPVMENDPAHDPELAKAVAVANRGKRRIAKKDFNVFDPRRKP